MADTLEQTETTETQTSAAEQEPTRSVRPTRVKMTREEVRKRMESFSEREEAFIAAVRKNQS